MLSKRTTLFSYFMIFLLLFLPPICINNNIYPLTNIEDILKVLPKIFVNEKFKLLPHLSILLKLINCVFISLFIFNKKIKKHLFKYMSIYVLFLALTQNISYIEHYGIVISTGSLALMTVTSIILFMIDNKKNHSFEINNKFFWMILIILICIWYPLNLNGDFDFDYNIFNHYLSSSMYCFNMPVFISLIMILKKNNSGILYELISLIGIIFAIITIIANASFVNNIPNMIMHFPLLISSLVMFLNSHYLKFKKYKKNIEIN